MAGVPFKISVDDFRNVNRKRRELGISFDCNGGNPHGLVDCCKADKSGEREVKTEVPVNGYSRSYLPLPYLRLVVQLPPVALPPAVTEGDGFLARWIP